MREQIEILVSLQNVDREIREKSGAKEELLTEIQKWQVEVEAKRVEMETLKAEWGERDKVRQDKEKVLQDDGKKAMDKRMNMNRIKNIKELQALQREIDLIKLGNAQLEDELIVVLEDLETRMASLKEKEGELKNLEQEWKKRQGEIEAQLTEAEQAVGKANEVRQAIIERLNGDLIERYELIFSRREGMAVVEVSDGICQGCYMNVPPQLWNEIIRNERLNTCPSCHRILYNKPTVSSDEHL